MSKVSVPDFDEPVVDERGKITRSWREYIKDLDKRAFNEKVSVTSPTNGQVLLYNATTGLWTPGAN